MVRALELVSKGFFWRKPSFIKALANLLIGGGILVFGAFALSAQEYRFSDIEVIGNERIDDLTVLSHTRIDIETDLTASDLNVAFQNLQKTGLFEKVDLSPRGETLVIEVKEYPTISRINFEGNKRIKDKVLATLISSEKRLVFNPSLAEEDAKKIANAYAQLGRISTTVDPVIIPRSNNRVDLVFEISETAVVETERITFIGNRSFSDKRLRRVLASKQAGIFRTLVRADVYLEDRLLLDAQVLTDFYQSRGFVDFRVVDSAVELTRERDAFFLTFKIEEGQRFRIGKISARSEIKGVDSNEFLKLNTMKEGAYYNPLLIDYSVIGMENLGLKKSIPFLRIEPQITRNDETLTLDLEYTFTRGPRQFVERINIRGNVTTLDRVIRRHFLAAEGDPLNPDEIRAAGERIRALGFFEDVDISSHEGSSPEKVVIDAIVEEKPTGKLGFGLAYSTSDGLGISASLREINFLGRGQTVGIDLKLLSEITVIGLDFIEPAFLDRDVVLDVRLQTRKIKKKDNEIYNISEILLRPQITYPISPKTKMALRLQLAHYKLSGVPSTNSNILKLEQGTHKRTGIGYSLIFDTRSDLAGFNRGHLLRLDQDLLGLGGQDLLLKNNVIYSIKRNIQNSDVVLKVVAEAGLLASLKGKTTIGDRYFLTTSQLRGFQSYTIGPRDTSVKDNDLLGGKKYFAVRSDLMFPLGLPTEYNMTGSVFLDVGSTWDLKKARLASVNDSMKLRSSAGFSLLWKTQIGPLRFNFARTLKKHPHDKPLAFEFTIESIF